MRSTWIAGLFFVGALTTTGCAVNSQPDQDDERASVTEEAVTASSIYTLLVGDYVSADGLKYPTLNLASSAWARTYTWDTGIRCITTPCPSGETGRWTVYRSLFTGKYFLQLRSTVGKIHWFGVDIDGEGKIKGLPGVWGETAFFVPKRVFEPVVGCAAMLCAEGTICYEDETGAGTCIAVPTCKDASCASGEYCAELPVECIKAPCPPMPTCLACPKPGVINCMPIVSPDVAPLCKAAESIKANCPGVEFVY
ncbi:MAG: hypothetical protein HYV09_40980 [Deltaproteobacteria bacterium]|nr:hypothetical protein [Deltaproteobacteria bacterium]